MVNYIFEHLLHVKKDEIKKFFMIFLIGNLVNFNFIMLRNLKDTFIMSNLGTSSIPIAKICYVLPISILFMFIYNKLANYYDGKTLFLISVLFFSLSFFIYNVFFIHVNSSISYYIFYTLAESWGTVTAGTAMWAYFNDICTLNQAKRFYVFISGVQIGSLIASLSTSFFVRVFKDFHSQAALYSVIISSILIILVVIFASEEKLEKEVFNPSNDSIFRGIKLVFNSKYLFLIFFITLCYNFTTIVVEYIWKSNLEVEYPNSKDLFIFIGNYSFFTTLISSFVSILFSASFIEYFGLTYALLIFPLFFGFSSTLYFFVYTNSLGGALQWIITKTSKYAFADPAKQILFIPCEKEERYKAKSVIEIFGARGGKAAASVFNYIFLKELIDFRDMARFSYLILFFIITLWVIAAFMVGAMFKILEINNRRKDDTSFTK